MPMAGAAGMPRPAKEPLGVAFFWLTVFCFFYCARPEDLIVPLQGLPIAKVASGMAILSLIVGASKLPRGLRDLPKEAWYLFSIIGLLFVSALLSPVWRGGAFSIVLDFSKVCIIWLLVFLLVTSFSRLRRIVFIQAASVAVVCAMALLKGHNVPRLNGVIGAAVYANPNDLAFAIVLSIPLCLAFLLSAKSTLRKLGWVAGLLVMGIALMLTASRAGLIDLLVSGAVALWLFGVKNKRLHLIVLTVIAAAGLFLFAGRDLQVRLVGLFSGGESGMQDSAYGSYQERRLLISRAIDAVEDYPLLGVGAGNFVVYSGYWREVHDTYLQIAADGGIPILVLFLMFLYRGFANLKTLGKVQSPDPEMVLFSGALKCSLIGFVVGAFFAPVAFQFFPYFTVCYTAVLVALAEEKHLVAGRVPKASVPFTPRFAKAWTA